MKELRKSVLRKDSVTEAEQCLESLIEQRSTCCYAFDSTIQGSGCGNIPTRIRYGSVNHIRQDPAI